MQNRNVINFIRRLAHIRINNNVGIQYNTVRNEQMPISMYNTIFVWCAQLRCRLLKPAEKPKQIYTKLFMLSRTCILAFFFADYEQSYQCLADCSLWLIDSHF